MAEAELATIARPYARAAFAHALEQEGGLGRWSSMLGLLASAVSEGVVAERLDDPKLTTEDVAAFLGLLFEADIDDEARNFINVLAEYGRIELLPHIAKQYELLKADHERTISVEVTSAYEVSDEEVDKLSVALKTKLQRDVNLTTAVDASLVGGVVIKAEDTVIDGSIRGKLRKLSQALQ